MNPVDPTTLAVMLGGTVVVISASIATGCLGASKRTADAPALGAGNVVVTVTNPVSGGTATIAFQYFQ